MNKEKLVRIWRDFREQYPKEEPYTVYEILEFAYSLGVKEATYNEARLAPESMTIPWDALSQEWRFAARDKSGEIWIFEEKPKVGGSTWWSVIGGASRRIDLLFADVDPGSCDWKDSLVERPDGV